MSQPTLIDTLQQTIDKNDPTQKAIGLLAVLVDSKINEIHTAMSEIKRKAEEQDEKIQGLSHDKACPFGLNAKVSEMEKALEPLVFVNRYPKLALLMLLGFLTLMGFGVERVIQFFN